MTEVGGAERQDVSPELSQATCDSLDDHGQVACVSHHYPPAFHAIRLVAEPFVLTHLSNRHAAGGPPSEPVQCVNGGTADQAIIRKTHVLLELLDCLVGPGAEDAVDPVWVESELTEPALEIRYVIAPHHRVAVVEEPITETVVGLHESIPGLGTADPVNHQATVALEAAQRSLSLGTELLRIPVDGVTDQSQPALEVANSVTGIAATQR